MPLSGLTRPFQCNPIKWGTRQYHDGWCAQCRCPWLAPPAADMQTIAAQGHDGMPGRFEWQARSLAVYLTGALPLGCHCPWQTSLQTTADRSGPQQCAAWECDNCHSDSHYYTGATSSPANTIESPSDYVAAINLQLKGALEQLQWASLTASAPVSQHSMPKRELSLAALGAPPSAGETEDPLGAEGTDSIIPALMATLTQTSPWAATQVATPASLTLLTHCSSQLWWRHWRQQAYPLSHSLSPLWG